MCLVGNDFLLEVLPFQVDLDHPSIQLSAETITARYSWASLADFVNLAVYLTMMTNVLAKDLLTVLC